MGCRALIITIFLLVLTAGLASGAESFFNTGITSVKNQIFSNETAEFALDIYSSSTRIESFSIYTDVEWSLSTDPSEDRNLKVYPNTKKETLVLIKPKSEARIFPGAYSVRIYLKNSKTGETITNSVILHIKGDGTTSQDYLPSVRAEAKIDPKIDPREPVQVTLTLENQNPADIEALQVFISSDHFSIQDTVTLPPLESKEFVYTAYMDDKEEPTLDMVRVNLKTVQDDRTFEFNSIPIDYEIISYGGIVEDAEVEKKFLKRTTTYRLTNTGNSNRQYEFKIKRNFILARFTDFDEEPAVKKIDGKKYYYYLLNIPINGEEVFVKKVNYRPLVLIILILIILAILFYVFRSPMLIRKSMVVTSQRDGGIAGITVQLDIKNRSPKAIRDLKIRDKVPNMFSLQKEFDVGTMHPSQILKHEKKGTILKWDIDDIEAFEERIITYRLNSRLNIIGKFTLPRASLTYEGRNKNKIMHSNKVLMTHRLK